MPETPLTVAHHLAAAKAAHADYRRASNATQLPQAKAAVQRALDARLAAAALDPEREASAWVGESIVHEEMVAFYRGYLDRCERVGV
jgi:hypothetical protein